MDVIEGDGDPEAHMDPREMPECDICQVALKGRMPKPLWMSPTGGRDEDGTARGPAFGSTCAGSTARR